MAVEQLAAPQIITRIRPVPSPAPAFAAEVITTHTAICPHCSRETRIGLGASATVYGSCVHFSSVKQAGEEISVMFREA